MCLDVAYLDMLITVLVNETCDQRDAEVQLLSLGLQSSLLTETKPPACSRRSLRGKTKKTRHTDSTVCYNNRLCWRITLFCCQTGAALRFLFLSDFPPSRSDRHLAYTTSFDLREDR